MSKLKSMKRFFSIGLIIILSLVYLIMVYFNYINKKDEMNHYEKTAVETSINGTLVQINAAEIAYNFIASRYENEMREEVLRFSKEVALFEGKPELINLEKIKKSGPHYYDYYIINSDNIIVNSTFNPVLGLDFKRWEDYSNALNKIRKSGKIETSTISTEITTGKLRKWAYLATKDKKYLLEIGLSDEELQKYAQPIDFNRLKNLIVKSSVLIKDVEIYDRHHMNLVTGLDIKNPKINTDLDKVYKTHEAMDFYDDKGFLTKKYMFFQGLSKTSVLYDGDRLLIVKYDNTKNIELLNNSRKNAILMFFLLIFILIVTTDFFVNKYIVNPITDLKNKVEKLSTNLLNADFEEYKIDEENGSEEISSLAKSFNTMADKLGNTLVSKEYLRNIINSVNDIIIITDNNAIILDANIYAKIVLNKCDEELIGKKLTELFTPKEKIEKIISNFKDETIKDEVDGIEVELITGEKTLSVIVNITTYYDKKGNIAGFINSAKDLTKLQNLVDSMQKKAAELLEDTKHDQLTHCLNRRGIGKRSKAVFALAKSKDIGFSVMMLDLDDFKSVNDIFGHQEGDKILKRFADIMEKNCRKKDSVVRYGGEEFFILLPNTDLNTALTVAERIKDVVARELSNIKDYQITVSGGVSEWKKSDAEFKDTLARADVALYKSKENGKNQINYQL